MREQLRPFHTAILIHMVQTGVLIMSLPHTLAVNFGYNGWIVVPIISVIVCVDIALIAVVYRLAKGRSVFEILEQSIPRLILIPFYVFLASLWAMIGSLVAKQYVLIIQMIAFPSTSPMQLLFAVEVLCLLLLVHGVFAISRGATAFFWLFFSMLLLLPLFFKEFNWSRATTFILQGGHDPLKGSFEVFSAFLGVELALLLFPFVSPRGFGRAVLAGHLLTTVSYTSISLVSFGFYSFGQLQLIVYPMMDLLAFIKFPFIERLETLLFGIFLFTVIITETMYSWAAVETLKRLRKPVTNPIQRSAKEVYKPSLGSKLLSVGVIAASFCASWIPTVLMEVEQWLSLLGRIELGVAFGLPLLLLLLLPFQNKKKEGQPNAS
ncbi:GerAB/ArcD/ProY family transporter [Paenibacillus koleovorans]|uniref:GerAB/ArcD/ProY family transporter n=1 Tax=Paenibacillus koleovorans TaxID=121608 RepID=UPI000FDB7D2B|nr:GerAB/ArcD/ProY family transporter [Paenibacillus koleovorans]